MATASQKPIIFICYMKQDFEAAARIYDFLLDAGADPWLDKKTLVPGDDWRREIKRAVDNSDACVVCLRPGFEKRGLKGFRHQEVRWAVQTLQVRPLGSAYIIPFIVEPCDLPAWCESIHAGRTDQKSKLEDLLPSINKHCAAELSSGRVSLRRNIERILREPNSPTSYRRKITLFLFWNRKVGFQELRKKCRKPPYTREQYLAQWQSLLDARVMATTGAHPDPICMLTSSARVILEELKPKGSEGGGRQFDESYWNAPWASMAKLTTFHSQNLRVIELAREGLSNDAISKKLSISVTDVADICREEQILTRSFELGSGGKKVG